MVHHAVTRLLQYFVIKKAAGAPTDGRGREVKLFPFSDGDIPVDEAFSYSMKLGASKARTAPLANTA
jgi:hypothetical protein